MVVVVGWVFELDLTMAIARAQSTWPVASRCIVGIQDMHSVVDASSLPTSSQVPQKQYSHVSQPTQYQELETERRGEK